MKRNNVFTIQHFYDVVKEQCQTCFKIGVLATIGWSRLRSFHGICTYVCVCVNIIFIYIYICVYVFICLYVCLYLCLEIFYTHDYTYVCAYVCIFTCRDIVCFLLFIYTFLNDIHIHMSKTKNHNIYST